jgi:hypothetical protein
MVILRKIWRWQFGSFGLSAVEELHLHLNANMRNVDDHE